MSKKKLTTRPVGRPRLNLPVKPRRFLQVERLGDFDAKLLQARKLMADLRGVPVNEIGQSEAVRIAVGFYVLDAKLAADRGEQKCPRCNGVGYIAVHNGDDDVPCPDCPDPNEMLPD